MGRSVFVCVAHRMQAGAPDGQAGRQRADAQEEERKMAETETLSGFLKNPEDFETANKIARSFEKLCEQIRKVFFDALMAEIKRQAEKTDGKFVGVRAGNSQKQTIEILVRGTASDGGEENAYYCGYETNLYCH